MNIDVYDVTNTTLQGTLSEAHNIAFLDDLTIPGFARFQIDAASTADLALCLPRRIVRFRTGASAGVGDVFAGIVQDRPTTLDDRVQPVGAVSTVTVECRGLLSWLGGREGGAVMYPAGGLEGRQQNPRVFGWTTEDFDDSGWGEVDTTMTGGALSTAGWPDSQAVAYEPIFEGDRALYRRVMLALPENEPLARMYLVGDIRTEINVYLDGALVLSKPRNSQGLFTADVPYDDIDHIVAVEVTGGTGRWGWTWVRLVEQTDPDDDSSYVLGGTLRRTFDPAVFPSATPWKSFEGGPVDWQLNAYVAGDEWVRPVADGPLTTAGWPDAQAVAYHSQTGRGRYFRQIESATALTGTSITVAAMFSTSVRVFIDGVQVGLKPSGRRGLFTFEDITYPGADFTLSVVVVGGGRWGLTWRDSASSVLRRTYDPETFVDADPWLYSPDETPGVTVGFVLKTALDEDGERHPDRPWSYSFTGTQDSVAEPWQVQFSRGFRVQEVGLLVDELVSIEGEPEATPSGAIRLLVRRGEDRTATVTVSSPFALNLSGRGPQATRWLYETQSGFGQALTDGPEADFGVMERFVQLGSDISSADIGQVIAAEVVKDAQTLDEVSVDLPDSVTPYVDVFLGDTVTCVGRSGSGPVRLTSFQASVDDGNGHVDWSATGRPV